MRSIVERSTYENYEIVCVIDALDRPAVLDELRAIAGDRLRLSAYDGPFNFSAKVNRGAIRSEGEHLLLLNDDIEVIDAGLDRAHGDVLGARRRSAPSAASLLWDDGRLQHVGVIFENGGCPGHLYRGFAGDFRGYANNVLLARNCLAVTGACLMTRRDALRAGRRPDHDLPVNYNDIDYCLKLHASGLRVVYDPDLVLYHFESSSRSAEVEEWEFEPARSNAGGSFAAPDPYDNPNLHRGVPRITSFFGWARRKRAQLPWRLRRRLAA